MSVYREARAAKKSGRVEADCPKCEGKGWFDQTPDDPAWVPKLCPCLKEPAPKPNAGEYHLPRINSIWRHKARGTTYIVLGHTRLQLPGEYDNCHAVTYRELGKPKANTWTRPAVEFLDGRFEKVNNDG